MSKYTEEDLRRLKIICYLREIGLPIDSIKQLLAEKNPESVILLLLDEQGSLLKSEISERKEKLDKLEKLKNELKHVEHFSVDSIGDIAHIMDNKKNLWRIRRNMLLIGLLMDAIEVATFMLWILEGIWQPFVIGMVIVIILGIFITKYYYENTVYICPRCHHVFRAGLRETLLARHTPKTRKLTCPQCDHHGFCVETYGKGEYDAEKIELQKL